MQGFPKEVKLSRKSLVLAIYTVAAFHVPFFRHALSQMEGGWNGVLLTVSAALLLLGLDFLLYYVLLYLGRFVGKCLVSFTLLGDAAMLYFVNNYEVLVTDEMMGNVFDTQYSEAAGFFSWAAVAYVVLLGVLPSIYVFARKTDYGSFRRFLGGVGIAVAALVAVVFGNMRNWPWIDRNSTVLGSLIAPWSYIVNSFRYYDARQKKEIPEILLPDARIATDTRDVCVLIIGESVRRENLHYFGYPKNTNPYTEQDGVTALPAVAAATNTMDAVRALLQPRASAELLEILPNYLYRTGVDVAWRTSNWGEPPTHFPNYVKMADLRKEYPDAPEYDYDGVLLCGLEEAIRSCGQSKQFIVLHTYTNHGPAYNTNYPPQFEVFTPVCNTVEMSRTSREELLNAYDNSLVYTDCLTHRVIEILRAFPDRRSCVLFVSDHGESLGENNLYMHGVPMAMAPREQIEIPFLVWTSESLPVKPLQEVTQYAVYHSVLDFLGIESPVFEAGMSVFEQPLR